MPLVKILSAKEKTELAAKDGENLYELLLRNNVEINAPCSGKHTCGKCKVRIADTEYSEEENRLLTEDEKSRGVHLACCVKVTGDMSISIGESKGAEIMSAVSGVSYDEPIVSRRSLSISQPDLQTQLSDCERVCKAASLHCEMDISMIRELPVMSRSASSGVFYGRRLINLDKGGKAYGAAVDIGTTTIAVYLYDLSNGDCIDIYTELNKQNRFGADVISRCEYAARGKGELDALNEVLISTINRAIEHFTGKINVQDIYHIVFAGNTVMMHLLLKINPQYIANAPFIPAFINRITLNAGELGINLNKAVIDVLPSVAGFVGADTVAAVIAAGIHESSEISLLIDIGTNGEMVLGNKEQMICCSAAAGPAFEGAHIHCGMGGAKGAINKVYDDFSYTVIGGGEPIGICGSGLLDAVHALVKAEIVSSSGRFKTSEKEYLLAPGINITQRDIRELQLAKGAICAGIELMLKTAGIRTSEVKKLYLAGGFGNYLDPVSASGIGVFPAELLDKITPIGNAAGAGAGKALLSEKVLLAADGIRDKLKYIELSAVSEFQDLFADNMELTERYF